jgi:pyridoxamine 5'-phosphate oxidase
VAHVTVAPVSQSAPLPGSEHLAALRRAYTRAGLDEGDLAADPVTQFGRWLTDAFEAGIAEPNAMVLATASATGRPSARTVLLKGYGEGGFVLFTNYGSRKGRDLAENPWAALVFPWHAIERQVCVEGPVERLSRAETAAYFRTRPHWSRIGAWASEQSAVIPSRAPLEERFAALAARWPVGTDVPVPSGWGGLRVVPETVEFWQGRESRLHDRLRYRRAPVGWIVQRLAP